MKVVILKSREFINMTRMKVGYREFTIYSLGAPRPVNSEWSATSPLSFPCCYEAAAMRPQLSSYTSIMPSNAVLKPDDAAFEIKQMDLRSRPA